MPDSAKKINFDKYIHAARCCQTMDLEGKIVKVAGLVAEADGPGMCVGSTCAIRTLDGHHIQAEVVGFNDKRVIVMPFGEMRGIAPGGRIVKINRQPSIQAGEALLGRVIDGLGNAIDNRGVIQTEETYPLFGRVSNPLSRKIITEVVDVGVASINALLTIGKGQRIAIMAGSGVGKSVLMGMIARNTTADVVIIALVGERGREVREFVERNMGQDGLKRSVVIAATSDSPALVRIRAAHLATAISEYFRDKRLNVMLIMDSITRFAMSLREVGLAAGEPPSAKGYTPTVFSQIPKLLERAGAFENGGSITGIYNVLAEGDDMNDPVADAVRSTADGHIVLSRKLAQRAHYPAVDVLASISRIMNNIVSPAQLKDARKLIRILSTYQDAEELISIGAYTQGSDPRIDLARAFFPKINAFLQQDIDQKVSFEESVERLTCLMRED